MKSKRLLLKSWKVYAVLDSRMIPDTRELDDVFLSLLDSCADVIQLRFKDISDPRFFRMASDMVARGRKKGTPIIINDRPDVALATGASGVHLGKGDVSSRTARRMLGPGAIIGRTIRNEKDLALLDAKDVDYAAIGPVFRTPLKPRLETVKPGVLKKVAGSAHVHTVAIGGINGTNAKKIASSGIKTAAVARYAATGKNLQEKMKRLKDIMSGRRP